MTNAIAIPRISAALEGEIGYLTGLHFQADELERIRALVTAQWLQQIGEETPAAVKQFETAGINHYHELCHLVNHETLWPKARRILGPDAVAEIRRMSLLRVL